MAASQEKIQYAKSMTVSQLIEVTQTSKMMDVFEEPQLREIGARDRQEAFVQWCVDDIYMNAGKNMDASTTERATFVKRFVNKFSFYTIGDIRYFTDCVIDGEYEIRFLCPTELFACWRSYLLKRGEAQDAYDKRNEAHIERNTEFVSLEVIEQGLKRITAVVADSQHWWDEWLETHREEYERLGAGDVNHSYEEFRQMKLAQLRAEGLAV